MRKRSNLYVSRPVANAQELLDWAANVGITSDLKPADLHVTVCYSRDEVVWADAPATPETLTVEFTPARHLEKLGPKGALVLRFESDDLAYRHTQFAGIGASHDFPEYLPHVTLSYSATDIDPAAVVPFQGALQFGPETFGAIDEGWVERVTTQKAPMIDPLIPRGLSTLGDSRKSEATRGQIALTNTKVSTMSARVQQFMSKLLKSIPDGALKDLEQIADYTDDKDLIPSAGDIGASSETIGMHGAVATALAAKNGTPAPQMGITKDYQEFAGRLGRMEKAVGSVATTVKSLVEAMQKADETESKDENPFEKAEQAVRKSRLAVRKAEDEDDKDDKSDAVEKAERLIVAAKAALEKAESCDMSEDDEGRMEKARKALRTVKSGLTAIREAIVAKASAEALAAAAAAAPPVETVAKADEPTVADLVKANSTLTDQLGVVTASLAEVMATVKGKGATPVAALQAAPVFLKSATPEMVATIAQKIEDADEGSQIGTGPLMKAHSLLTSLKAVQDGKMEPTEFDKQLASADPAVQRLFADVA